MSKSVTKKSTKVFNLFLHYVLLLLYVLDKGKKSKRITLKFSVDCSVPVEDEIMDVTSFVSYLIYMAWSFAQLS